MKDGRIVQMAMMVASAAAMAVQPRVVLSGTPAQAAGAPPAAATNVEGPTFSKSLATPDPVPEAGQVRAMELMNSGAMFRYTPGVLSETALAEQAVCDYTGFKYSVGFNSCGSALFIALKCAGVEPSDEVLCNAFSFTAVPSAIHHAGAKPVYVESNDAFVVDMADLEKKIAGGAKFLMLTHMRGKVADISKAYELAEQHGITVVEDCAHALGIQWEGEQLGRKAKVACFSTQVGVPAERVPANRPTKSPRCVPLSLSSPHSLPRRVSALRLARARPKPHTLLGRFRPHLLRLLTVDSLLLCLINISPPK